jgi:ABC-type amino acid transport substrate-binding protein
MVTRATAMAARARRIARSWIAARPRLVMLGLLSVLVLIPVLTWLITREIVPPLDEIFPAGEIIITVDPGNPPLAFFDADGEVYGLEIDLGREIGRRLGLPVRFAPHGFDGLYDTLITGQADMAIAALIVDPARMVDFRYSWAYFNAGLVLVSPQSAPIESMIDIPGHALAYEFGSSADTRAREWSRRAAAFEHRPYELPEHALDAVRLGQADAALVDAISARLYLDQHPEWEARYDEVTSVLYAAAFRIDRKYANIVVNQVLLEMINDGTLAEIINRWM